MKLLLKSSHQDLELVRGTNESDKNYRFRQQLAKESTLLVSSTSNSPDIERVRKRVEACGNQPSPIYQFCNCGYRRGSYQCNHPHLCRRCARRQARKLSNEIKESVKYLPQQINGFRVKRIRFLTLTVYTAEDPEKCRKDLISSLNRFLNRKYQRDRIKGAVASIHIEKSKFIEGQFHVHFHLMIYSTWLDNKNYTLSNEWSASTRGDGKIVHIEAIRNQNQAIDFLSNYLLKHSPYSFDERVKLFFKKRFFFRYGCFNKGSPKNILILIEEKICAECELPMQSVLSESEEAKHFGNIPPPSYPKVITKFFVICPSCDTKVKPIYFNFDSQCCDSCHEIKFPSLISK